MPYKTWVRLPLLAILCAGVALGGCQSQTTVSATGNTPAQYTHVFLTVNQVWFNTSATATPTDTSWTKFALSTPVTVDLVTLNNGTLSQIASSLKLSSGTYGQVMLILADSTDTLTTSASTAGAATNDEVDYIDAADVSHTVPLAILNAAEGIGIVTSLTVAASSSSGLGGLGDSSAATSSTSTATSSSTSLSAVVASTSVIVNFDATRDLVPISLSGQPAFALNPHPTTYNVSSSGTIQGAVSLTNVTTLTNADWPDVQVAAEGLSSDGTRHVVAATTRVGTDGTFILYPLSTASGAASTYDIVIHGPEIQTVIIKAVPVTNAAPGSAAALLGTVTLTAATPYLVNLSAAASPTSSSVGFYQTLPLSGEVPYLIEQRALDPTSGEFASAQELSNGPLQYGSYATSGGTVTLTAANPTQGGATYSIGAVNPAYGEATLSTTVAAPASSAATALFTMSAPPAPSGATADAITGTITVSGTAYDNAELFLTYNGALVAAAPLTTYLGSGSSNLSLSAVAPGGSAAATYAAGVYYGEIWAWNSSNPTGTLTRIPSATPINMSAGNATGVTLSIN